MSFSSFQEKSRLGDGFAAALVLVLAFTCGVFLAFLAAHIPMFLARFHYPLDLEWMESGVLTHVERILEGKPIYAPPSAEFIPFAYTPLFYFAAAGVSLFAGISFAAARSVSLLSLLLLAAGYATVAFSPRPGPQGRLQAVWAALAGCTLLLLNYFTAGAWLDLARPDTLALALALWGGIVLTAGGGISAPSTAGPAPGYKSTVLSALLFSLAFWTKQTMAIPLGAAALWLLAVDRRRALLFAAIAALAVGGGLLLANWRTQGWAWFYLREIHRLHSFDRHRAWVETPQQILSRLWPALLACAVILPAVRPLSSRLSFWWLMALSGTIAACIGSGTQWAHTNALLPAFAFTAAAVTATLAPPAQTTRKSLPSKAFLAAASVLLLFFVHSRHPSAAQYRHATPQPQDFAAAAAHIRELRALPGPILVPYHPWSARLAGSPAHFHQHALSDIRAAGRPVPGDIVRGLRENRWNAIVHDRFGPVFHRQWPGLEAFYRPAGPLRVRGVRTFSGNPCGPRFLWRPKTP